MGIIDNARELADLIKKIGDAELYSKIVDLKSQVVTLAGRNYEVEAELRDANAKLAQREQLKYREPYCWADGDDVPFCPTCWENGEKAIHLTPPQEWNGGLRRQCRACQQFIYEKPMRPISSFRRQPYGGSQSWMGN